jgi:formylglycine-generating enzyme required for sulfatase activity
MRVALNAPLEDSGERTVKLELPLRPDLHRSGEKPRPALVEPAREPSPSPARPRWNGWRWGIGLLAILAVGGGGIAYWWTGPPTSSNGPPVEPAVSRLCQNLQAGPPANPQSGQIYTDPETGMVFVWVPPGCFGMGSQENERDRSANEVPHRVCLKGFWMGQFEVTNEQYRRFDANHDSGGYEYPCL